VIGYAQRGFTLIESTVAVAIVSVAISSLIFVIGAFGRFSAHQSGPVHSAAIVLAQQTLRIAENAWKYGSPGNSPAGSIQTTVPVLTPNSAATTVPVTLRTNVTAAGSTSSQITVSVQYTPDPDHPQDSGILTLSGDVQVKAPLPASTLTPAALIAQPTNAP